MIRAWILFSCLIFSVLFRVFHKYGKAEIEGFETWRIGFFFHKTFLNVESWIYYAMEHLIAIGYAACILIRDSTPRWLLWLFLAIIIADFVHYGLFYRDEGIGFNLAKVLIFGIPLCYLEIKQQWDRLKS